MYITVRFESGKLTWTLAAAAVAAAAAAPDAGGD